MPKGDIGCRAGLNGPPGSPGKLLRSKCRGSPELLLMPGDKPDEEFAEGEGAPKLAMEPSLALPGLARPSEPWSEDPGIFGEAPGDRLPLGT